jgi:hypothetical protein
MSGLDYEKPLEVLSKVTVFFVPMAELICRESHETH